MADTTRELALGGWQRVTTAGTDQPPVFLAVAQPASVNIGLVVGNEGCLVVDTGSSPAQGRAIRAAVAEVTDLPIAGVVVTHAHFDHFFGLAGFDGVESYGHESLRDRLTDAGLADVTAGLGFDAAELVAPSRQLVVAAAIDLGGVRVEIAHLGRGHTEGDLIVTVSTGTAPVVVFAGDLVETAGSPWFGTDARPFEWPGTLDGVLGLLGPTTLLVPGHGEVVTRDPVFAQRGEIGAVAGEIQRLMESGIVLADAAEEGRWPFPAGNIADCLPPTYAMLASRGVRQTRSTLPLVEL